MLLFLLRSYERKQTIFFSLTVATLIIIFIEFCGQNIPTNSNYYQTLIDIIPTTNTSKFICTYLLKFSFDAWSC